MAATIYKVTVRVPGECNDGRSPTVFWGHEKAYHATRESAEASCERLQEHGGYGCDDSPEYHVVEQTREDFEPGAFGERDWREACQQAGIDPSSGVVLV